MKRLILYRFTAVALLLLLQALPPRPPLALATTPAVLVNEPWSGFVLGGGLLYWWDNCIATGEFPKDGYLRLMPAQGGPAKTLATFKSTDCNTIEYAAADENILYYYNREKRQIEQRVPPPPGSSPNPPTILRGFAEGTEPAPIGNLALDDSFVYWPSKTGILRHPRNALRSGASQQIGWGADPRAVAVHGDHVYWIRDTSLWRVERDCSPAWSCAAKQKKLTQGVFTGDDPPWRHLLVRESTCGALADPMVWIASSSYIYLYGKNCNNGVLVEPPFPVYYSGGLLWTIGPLADSGPAVLAPKYHVFWSESYATLDQGADSRLRRMYAGEIIEDWVDIDVNLGRISSPGPVFTDNKYVYYGSAAEIRRLPLDATPIFRDLEANRLEVTQGLQRLDNSIQLIAGKSTFVRLYGGNIPGPAANTVQAILQGSRDGKPLPGSPLQPLDGARVMSAFTVDLLNREATTGGWTFELPASWTEAGTISLRATVDPKGLYPDKNPDNNVVAGGVTFHIRAPSCPIFIPVTTHVPWVDWPSHTDPNVDRIIDFLYRVYPISDVWVYHVDDRIENDDFADGAYELDEDVDGDDDSDSIIVTLAAIQAFSDDPDACEDANAQIHWIGMVHPDTATDRGGYGAKDPSVLWIKLPPRTDPPTPDFALRRIASLAHEMGHNLNRDHVDCPTGDPEDPDPHYPYDPCKLDDFGLVGHFGYDVNTGTPLPPDTTADLMSYASKLDRPLWMSDYTWKALWGDFAADAAGSTRSWVARNRTRGVNDPGPAAAAAAMLVSSSILLSSLGQDELNYAGIVPTSSVSPTVLERSQVGGTQTQAVAAAELATAASVVLVSGILNPSLGQAELNYAWVMPTSSVSPGILQKWQRLVAPAASAREGVHPAGRYYSLRLLDPNGAVLADRAFAPLKIAHGLGKKKAFFVTFPAPVGSVARIELLDGTVVLASRMPGLSAPAVSILQPTGRDTITGGPTVVFRAIDPDGDRLLYIVQYCPELSKGPRCYTLAKGLPVPVGSEVVTFARPSFAGFPGSTTARFRVIISDGFHTTMASSPAFSVPNRSPRPAIVVPATGQTVPAGRPVTLKGSATDVEDGGLPGAALKWMVDGRDLGSGKQQRIDGLAPGIHDVTLRVADRSGLQATATVSFTVDLLQVPVRTTPTLDGDCEDLAYATGAKLSLRPYADGDQATVYLVHTRDHLWACFAGLKRSTDGGVSGAYAGLRIDVDNSRDPAVATDDLGVFVGEDGAPFTAAGANLAAAGPDAMVARVGASEATWRAELRIAASKLRGWEHLVSLAVGHFSLGAADHAWPYLADAAKPNTWARTQFVRRRAPSPPESANR